jgi:hypothetical protein
MSLPASQRRALGSMEDRLMAADPHLATMFGIFDRLNAGEPVAAERLADHLKRRWPRPRLAPCAAVLIPVMFMAMIVLSALAGGPRSPRACEGDYPAGVSSPLARPACRLTADTAAVKATTVTTPDGTGDPACAAVALHGRPARGWVC